MRRYPLPFVALTALLLTAAGCSSESSVAGAEQPGSEPITFQNVADTTFTDVAAGSHGNYDFTDQSDAQNLVIDSKSAFTEFWNALYANRSEIPERLQIDFSEQVVVAALMAPKNTGGYDIEITDITSTSDGGARVRIVKTHPGDGCMVTQALTQPYHLVKANAPSGDFSFTTETNTRTCN